MNNVLVAGEIVADAGVAIEYTIPQTAKRIDFILTGKDGEPHPSCQAWTYVARC